jgi:energy-coupling factor transporter transmembrane protein EcfT
MGLFLFFIFLFLRVVFTLLYYLTPVIFIFILIFDSGVLVKYGAMLGQKIKNNWLWGLIQTGLSILFLPLVLTYLLFQAILNKQIKNHSRSTPERNEWTDFEELESKIPVKKANPQDLV